MAKGPLVVRFGDSTLNDPQAGTTGHAEVEVENAGTIRWGPEIRIAYHWLDERDNPIFWDGERTELPPLAPGERAKVPMEVKAPIPPGRYHFAFDLVAEHRAWFSELGNDLVTQAVDVRPRTGKHHADLPSSVEPAADWAERVAAAHAEGYGVVCGAIVWNGGRGLFHRPPRALAPYAPGPGRVPGFAHALLCPSVLEGVELERLPDVEGLPAFAAPEPWTEPWIYDGRIVLKAHPRHRAQ
jgi:hypothetical protein